MSEYHKIETLYERDEATHRLKPELTLKNRVYGIIKTWYWTEKIDGTNIRAIWQGGKLSFGGKTDNASIPADLVKWLYENITPEKLAACFPDGGDVVIYGEGYGAGIQRGGLYGPTKKFIVFDVLIDEWWLKCKDIEDVCASLGLDTVPFLAETTIDKACRFVAYGQMKSVLGEAPAEGVVGRPAVEVRDRRGRRVITKIKAVDYAHLQ